MSHAGPPPDQPQPDPNQPDPNHHPDPPAPGPGATGEPETPPEQPWSPYPAGWDQPKHSGQADPSPYGQPAPPPNPYDQNPYGAAPYAAPAGPTGVNPYAGPVRPDRPVFGFAGYASWFSRVGAFLIDAFVGAAAGFPLWIGYGLLVANTTTITQPDGSTKSTYDGSTALPVTMLVIGALTSIAFYVWNICLRQGRTGASIGKSALAIRLVNSDQQPIGAGWSFLRNLLHIVDELPCACLPLGYLWPIWDEHKQTFADKIMSTYVIHATEVQPRPY